MSSYLVTFTETIEHYVSVEALNRSQAEEAGYQVAYAAKHEHECGDDCSTSGWDLQDVEEQFSEPDRMP